MPRVDGLARHAIRQTTCRCFSLVPPSAKDKGKAKAGEDVDTKRFSDTLLLPKTAFPPRAQWAKEGQRWRQRTTKALWDWQSRQTTRPVWLLHDGPPYANGHLHMGHALNKILKDIVNRYKLLRGSRVHYRPGFDCHGLPIELKALASPSTRPAGASTEPRLDPTSIRRAARTTAEAGAALQKQEFDKFGILADWDSAWLTMDHDYEIRQLKVFAQLAASGFIHRATKPVLFSPSSRTALAEAEVEYRDDHVSRSVYLVSNVASRSPAMKDVCGDEQEMGMVVWTTTPWTLLANQAVAVAPHKKYTVARASWTARKLVIASERLAAMQDTVAPRTLQPLHELDGRDLLGATYVPLSGNSKDPLPVIPADHVTTDSGTGLVHTAPAHGVEDFLAYRNFLAREQPGAKPQLLDLVDDEGRFRPAAGPGLAGKEVLSDGGDAVVEMLKAEGAVVEEVKIRHKYPYDWRTKKPVITKATPQWFANLEPIKTRALAALTAVAFHPPQSRTRLESFVKGRSEWCISRQRAWGVPIPVLYDAATDEPVSTPDVVAHILGILEAKGVDHWWSEEVDEFVPIDLKDSGKRYRKGKDTLDVWFDSGCSWTVVDSDASTGRPRDAPIADMVLEGSDQHRGWFQSLLLTAVAGQLGKAPYGQVVTHGFSLDSDGRKMSKSLGNVISPIEIIDGSHDGKKPAYGPDVLRLWAASVDYTNDHPVGHEILQRMADTLKKIRLTIRWLVGNLDGADFHHPVPLELDKLDLTDRYMLHLLADFDLRVRTAYDALSFNEVMQHITHFTNSSLSSFYFDRSKDLLYNDARSSPARQAVVGILARILDAYRAALAPICPHLVEEADALSFRTEPSALARPWPVIDATWRDAHLESAMQPVLSLQEALNAHLDRLRSNLKRITGAAETEAVIDVSQSPDSPFAKTLLEHAASLPRLFGMSDVAVCDRKTATDVVINLASPAWRETFTFGPPGGASVPIEVHILPAWRQKCPRCWAFTRETGEDLCARCTDVLLAASPAAHHQHAS